MKFGVLDSGIGGLSVLLEIVNSNCLGEFYYLGDNLNAPYGDKTKKQLIDITNKNVQTFLNLGINKIIVACNTLSTTLKNYLNKKYKNVKFYYIYPNLSFLNNLDGLCYVLCTKNTAKNLKKQNIKNKNLEIIACSGLVDLLENDFFSVKFKDLKKFLPKKQPKYLYLGCTHYPLVSTLLKKAYKNAIFYDGISEFVASINFVKSQNYAKIYFIGESKYKNAKIFTFFKKNYEKWIKFH